MSAPVKRLLLVALVMVGVVLLGAVIWLSLAIGKGDPSAHTEDAFSLVTTAAALAVFTVLIHVLGNGAVKLIMGRDRRVSTSKFQLLLWTYAIGGAILALVIATFLGVDEGFDKLTADDFDPEDYLVLLGGPFFAAVSARLIVGSQVAGGEAVKPPGEPRAAQIVTDDDGNADLVDTQYLLFNLVALTYFIGTFVQAPRDGLPDIPTVLLVLTGASAAGYVSNKAAAAATPKLTGIYPAAGPPGTLIQLFGTNLLHPRTDGAADARTVTDVLDVWVMVDKLPAVVVEGSVSHGTSGDDRLSATIPATLTPGPHDVTVLNFRGTSSNAVSFTVPEPSAPGGPGGPGGPA